MKNVFVKLTAILMVVAMILGVCACSATNTNPVIGKAGKVKMTLAQYQSLITQYSYYYQLGYFQGIDFGDFIKEQLVAYAVTLNQCYVQGIELNDEEEAELAKKVQEQIDSDLEQFKVDSSITDETEIYEARMKQLKAELRKNGSSFNTYKKRLEQENRENMLMTKLRDQVHAEVVFPDDKVKGYFESQLEDQKKKYRDESDTNVSDFYNAYVNYLAGNAMVPFYEPKGMFTVKHLLVKYTNADAIKDGAEGVFDAVAQEKIDGIIEQLSSGNLTYEEFEELVKEKGEDQGYDQDYYWENGYLMNEELLSKYFDGFGYVAMKLYAGEKWEPKPDEDEDKTGTDGEKEPTYTLGHTYTLADGETKVSVVYTKEGGIHFVYIKHHELPEYDTESGELVFVDDTENEVWKNIRDFRLEELQDEHYTLRYDEWKAATKITLKDSYIDQIAAQYGI